MSIPTYASKIKSSGIYRFVFDKSVVPVTERKTLRLVIGYSEKGPFNTPVYIEEANDFIRQFGNISRRMERKGIFFHRLALQALAAGPILVLNLKPFNVNEPEKAEIYAFNANDLITGTNINKGEVLVAPNGTTRGVGLSTIYDTNRFWYIDPQRIHSMHGSLRNNTNDYVRILQTSSKEDSCTVFIRGYKPSNYDIKISDWYAGTGTEMPIYMEAIQDHLLSEYFAEIYVFRGSLQNDELFKHTGTLGNNRSFKFNYKTYVTDYVDHEGQEQKGVTNESAYALGSNDTSYYSLEDGSVFHYNGGKKVFVEAKNTKTITQLYSIEVVGTDKVYKGRDLVELVKSQFEMIGTQVPKFITPEHERIISWQPYCFIDGGVARINKNFVDTYNRPMDALEAMSSASTSGFVGVYSGAMFPGFRDANGALIGLDSRFNADFKEHKMLMHFDEQLLEKTLDIDVNENGEYDGAEAFHIKTNARGEFGDGETIHHMYSPAQAINALCSPTYVRYNVIDDVSKDEYVEEFKHSLDAYVVANGGSTYEDADNKTKVESILTILNNVQYTGRDALDEYFEFIKANGNKEQKKEASKLEERYKGKVADDYYKAEANKATPGIYIKGYDYKSIKKSESGKALVDKIMGVLGYKGIREALTNNVDVDYHYIVDTFQAYPSVSMKSDFFGIAKEKDNAFSITNFPDMDSIMRHVGYEGHRGGFDMKKIIDPTSGITLPGEPQGASFGAFYTQLQFTDGSSKFNIPSAALVSNLFMEKWKTRQPYYIVAGPNHGRIESLGLISPDYSYSRPDLDVLEPMGVNAIIHMPRRGIVINSNQTAKQTPVSALSKVHVRELIIFLQNEIEDMLRGYQWELNTQELRANIKAKADNILGVIQANGGVYAFNTQCDDKNNTPEVIDNEMVILDIDIEPARGAGKMIQTLTIHRTGGIKSK